MRLGGGDVDVIVIYCNYLVGADVDGIAGSIQGVDGVGIMTVSRSRYLTPFIS